MSATDSSATADVLAATPLPPTKREAAGGRAGRRPSAVWEFFTELRTPSGKVHARCNFCARQCAGVAARMVRHIVSKCPSAPEDAALALSAAEAATKRRRLSAQPPPPPSTAAVLLPEQPSASEMLAAALVAPPSSGPTVPPAAPVDINPAALEVEVAPPLPRQPRASGAVGGFTALETAALRRQLVLACVLHDVPPAFVEDEALRQAFAVARPGLPPLRADLARSAVLAEVHAEVQARAASVLAQAASVTLVYRHWDARRPGVVVDQVVGVDDRGTSMLLLEQERPATAATTGGCCLAADALDALARKLTAQTPPEAVVDLCVACPAALAGLRALRAAAAAPPIDGLAPGASPAPARRSLALLGTCLLRQSLALRKELLSASPPLVDVLGQAALLAHSIVGSALVGLPLRRQLHRVLAAPPSWDLHARLVKRVLALERDVRAVTIAAAATHDDFWARLREADALLTPFSWMLALSRVRSASSGQFVLLWLWALSLSRASPLVTGSAFEDAAMRALRLSCGDAHPLVCLLLDPRTRGAGLSATGRRHVKSLVVRVAARLAPALAEGDGRARLLDQLSHFAARSAQFADEIAWEMSVGRDPAGFWDDFSADTPELTRVARGVLSFPAVAQDVDEFLAPGGSCEREDDKSPWGQTFAVRQIKHQFWMNGHHRGSAARSSRACGRADSVAAADRELLAPPAPVLALTLGADAALEGDAQLSPVAPADAAVEVFVLEQIQQLALLNDTTLGQQGPEGKDGAAEGSTDAVVPIAIDWFALSMPADRAALEQAVARFLPGTAL